MTLETPVTPHNEDLDKADRSDKWRLAVWILVLLLIGALTWILLVQNSNARLQASSEASQKFTLAQQVAAACAVRDQADDLGGLCASAKQIVKEGPVGSPGIQGPPGNVGSQGPLGPKGEPGSQGNQGFLGAQGNQGFQGIQGIQGIFGSPGDTGAAGSPGVIGPVGAEGKIGPAGPAGATSPPGATGPAGAVGPTGPTGPIGPAGPAGPAGPPGVSIPVPTQITPLVFTATNNNKSFTCTLTAPAAVATCVAN